MLNYVQTRIRRDESDTNTKSRELDRLVTIRALEQNEKLTLLNNIQSGVAVE